MNFKARLKFNKVHKPQSNYQKERLLKSHQIVNVNDIIIFHFHYKKLVLIRIWFKHLRI